MAPARTRRSHRGTVWCACLCVRALWAGLVGCGAAFAAVRAPPPSASVRQALCRSAERGHGAEDNCLGEAVASVHEWVSSQWQSRSLLGGPGCACLGIGMLGACLATLSAKRRSLPRVTLPKGLRSRLASFEAKRTTLFSRRRQGRTALAAAQEGGTAVAVRPKMTEEERKEQFRALCTTLLREVGNADDIIDATGGDGELDFPGFCSLLKKLDVQCDEPQSEELFKMLDKDGSGYLSVGEIKKELRASGVITELYNEGIQNSLLALIPAVLLAIGFGVTKGPSAGFDFVAGYVVEDSLSVDNLFVFLIIFKYFKVPPDLQKICLDYGIYGAVILRAVFIFLGLAAVNSFKPVLLIFAFILLYASFSALTGGEEEDEEDEGPPEIIKAVVEALPTTENFDGDKLFIKEGERLLATPLALCIVSIELSDILFAVDSVPAVFAVTEDPLIVFSSNIAAILGLRSLYQILSIAVQDLVYLEKSAAIILAFVGLKLVLEVLGLEISSAASLGFIIFTLGAGIVLSLIVAEDKDKGRTKKKVTIERLLANLRKIFSGKGT